MKKSEDTQNLNIEDIIVDDDKSTESLKEEETVDKKDEASLEEIVKNDYQEQTMVQLEPVVTNKIGIASDHRGYKMKQKITKYLNKKGYIVVDYGGEGLSNDDYTEFGFKLGKAVSNHDVEKGIAICGSGIGISIACNKVKKVRCAKVDNTSEVKWARRDNDANIIAISGKMPLFRAKDIVDAFLKYSFNGAERYKRRIAQLDDYKD